MELIVTKWKLICVCIYIYICVCVCVVVQLKRLRLLGCIPKFICTVDKKKSNNGRPKSWQCSYCGGQIGVTLFYTCCVNGPLFPKEIRARSLPSREGFFVTTLISSSPNFSNSFHSYLQTSLSGIVMTRGLFSTLMDPFEPFS